jgi:hypothetical protein
VRWQCCFIYFFGKCLSSSAVKETGQNVTYVTPFLQCTIIYNHRISEIERWRGLHLVFRIFLVHIRYVWFCFRGKRPYPDQYNIIIIQRHWHQCFAYTRTDVWMDVLGIVFRGGTRNDHKSAKRWTAAVFILLPKTPAANGRNLQ